MGAGISPGVLKKGPESEVPGMLRIPRHLKLGDRRESLIEEELENNFNSDDEEFIYEPIGCAFGGRYMQGRVSRITGKPVGHRKPYSTSVDSTQIWLGPTIRV